MKKKKKEKKKGPDGRKDAGLRNFGVCKTKGRRNCMWSCTLVGKVVSSGVQANNSEITLHTAGAFRSWTIMKVDGGPVSLSAGVGGYRAARGKARMVRAVLG